MAHDHYIFSYVLYSADVHVFSMAYNAMHTPWNDEDKLVPIGSCFTVRCVTYMLNIRALFDNKTP